MKCDPNDPARPLRYMVERHGDGEMVIGEQFSGLTKREHFAALMMQGLISGSWLSGSTPATVAKLALACADDLITELNK